MPQTLYSLCFCLYLVPTRSNKRSTFRFPDPASHAMKGIRITTKCPGTTETTDDAGKATLTYRPPVGNSKGPVDLVIVSPTTLDFISPWQRSVTVPPDYWPITLVPHGQREMLEHPKVVVSLAARANQLQLRKSAEEAAPSSQTRIRAIIFGCG